MLLFLLACAAVYVGAVESAFSTLKRLPLRLSAERNGRLAPLGTYLDDPLRLFIPVRLLQGLIFVVVTAVSVLMVGRHGIPSERLLAVALITFVFMCGHLLPLLIVRKNPERVLELLLPSFGLIARSLRPVTDPLVGLLDGWLHWSNGLTSGDAVDGVGNGRETLQANDRAAIEKQEEQLLQSVVEFGNTLVHEVMTPRPDIVAVRSDATLSELQELFADEQYSRLPVYSGSLDNILGFVFVKDLVSLPGVLGDEQVIDRLLRPAYVISETKRVAELLKELQREQAQSAIVHDEYGGTAGLVTIEDLLEEIVGEIRDEYDVEAEPIVNEGTGSFVFNGRVKIDDLSRRLNVEIEPLGFETVAGYLLTRFGRVPKVGESFDVDGLSVEVLDADRRRLRRVRVRRRVNEAAGDP